MYIVTKHDLLRHFGSHFLHVQLILFLSLYPFGLPWELPNSSSSVQQSWRSWFIQDCFMQSRLPFSVKYLRVPDPVEGSGSIVTKVKIKGKLQHFDLVCCALTLHLSSAGSVFSPVPHSPSSDRVAEWVPSRSLRFPHPGQWTGLKWTEIWTCTESQLIYQTKS